MSALVHLSRRYRLSASHRLHVPAFSDEKNRETFGKCNNPYGHGHNYVVELTVRGAIHPDTGMVVALAALDAFVHREIVERFDHNNLNTDPLFSGALVPSTENFAAELEKILEKGAEDLGVSLHRVRVEETGNNSFDLLMNESSATTF